MKLLAVDIGGSKLAAAQISSDGQLHQRREIPTPASNAPHALEQGLRELIMPLQPGMDRLAVASTGIINQGTLTALNPDNLGGLNHFPLQRYLTGLTGLPCYVLNDAQAAAWAEYQALPQRVDNMAFLTVSTGVGGGLIINGKLLTGSGGLAGHLGHTLADPNGIRCGCGRTGCVETIASGRGIAAAARDDLQGLDAKQIFRQAANGHAQAQQLIQHSARTIAGLIANLKATLDCQQIIIGGSVGLAAGYLSYLQQFLAHYPAAYQLPVDSAHHQRDAGLIGAALWALEQIS